LDRSSEPAPLRDSLNVDARNLSKRADAEGRSRDEFGAFGILARLGGRNDVALVDEGHLADDVRRSDSESLEDGLLRLLRGLPALAERKLIGPITVSLLGLDLQNRARPGFEDGHRDDAALIGEDLRH